MRGKLARWRLAIKAADPRTSRGSGNTLSNRKIRKENMNWNAVEQHQQALEIIIDASIPNKSQNQAIKKQIQCEINTLMNRIADGWLTSISPDVALPTSEQV